MRLNLYQIGCTISMYMSTTTAVVLPNQFAESDAELAGSY